MEILTADELMKQFPQVDLRARGSSMMVGHTKYDVQGNSVLKANIEGLMKEFARLHVEAALKAAAIAADNDIFTYEEVLYAYPLENIK